MLREPNVRLITLIGTPGTGKTRLATHVAAGFASPPTAAAGPPVFPDGVFFIQLAAVNEPEMVERGIAQALEVTEAGERSLHDNLLAYLNDKRLLLVLDNFEHLLSTAPLVAELLAQSQGLKIIATSRAVLNLRGEHEYPVLPMTVPGRDTPSRPDELAQFEGTALFMQRAIEVSPNFDLTRDNARSVAEICRRLEGLPLAIELAAARVKVLSPEAILSRLDRRLKLLVGGRLDLPPRQQALETTIAWSYNLLDESEKALFRGISVFAGGCSLEAAETILDFGFWNLDGQENAGPIQMPDEEERTTIQNPGVLDTATSLLNKSLLVRVEGHRGEPRFSMLETLKEYGRERLEEKGEADATMRRHALYFSTLAEQAYSKLVGPEQLDWLQLLESEHDNMSAALRWACESGRPQDIEIALRLAGSLGRFWELRGYLSEGRSWLDRALALDGAHAHAASRALALYSSGSLAVRQRDYAAAERHLEESARLYRESGKREELSYTLNALAVLAADQDYERAVALHEENLTLRRELGNKLAVAASLHNIAYIRMHQGRWDEALAMGTEAHAGFREMGNASGQATSLYVLGMVAGGQEDYLIARTRLEEALTQFRQMSNNWMSAWTLHGLGEVLYQSGDYEHANGVFAEAEELFRGLGDKLGMARALISRGRENFRTGNYPEAADLFRQALEIGEELDNSLLVGCSIAGFAGLAGLHGHLRESALLFGVASDLLLTVDSSLERCAMTLNRDEVHAALDAKDPQAWDTAWTQGTNTQWQQAAALARSIA
jgi:predicted ATPase